MLAHQGPKLRTASRLVPARPNAGETSRRPLVMPLRRAADLPLYRSRWGVRPGSCVVQSQACVRADKGVCERFRTFSSCARPFGLLHPTARVSFAGSYLEGFKGQRARTILRVVFFVGSKVLKVRPRVPWSSRVFATNAEWSLKSSSLIRADDLTIAIARVEANVQKASSLP